MKRARLHLVPSIVCGRTRRLPQVLFQSITHMAPGAAIAFSVFFGGVAGPALLRWLALIAFTLVAVSIGRLARKVPSAAGSTRT
jgi:hypothetical protein